METLTSLINSKPVVGFTMALIGASIYVFRTPKSAKTRRGLIWLILVGLSIAGVLIFR